ncbi:hypothetical protein OCT63_17210 [Vibrio sp. RW]|uniref:hypothetical protein n=1 Tax=Vibrio sp. RW TaxID=2998833 RepID=UPI0022CD7187|nr:hypothetical protein [Vibrio sp. RW]MDA0145967.1 hypothetical protein [Vibrio sp. RW]
MMKKVQFVGIDSFNRPIFKSMTDKAHYGSTETLFSYDATESEVLEKVGANDLSYFGSRFDCEPMGVKPQQPLVIVGAS